MRHPFTRDRDIGVEPEHRIGRPDYPATRHRRERLLDNGKEVLVFFGFEKAYRGFAKNVEFVFEERHRTDRRTRQPAASDPSGLVRIGPAPSRPKTANRPPVKRR
ncbi:hypothetical protein DLM86_15540 [Paenibacillus flagellatus]|uniref:Uncharacterized protein n=1 Tax=Paenibacillus flagellatus TaxID=2211139 RepID=A0A2V5K7I1_9BACL|nr:hypothetical protein DLM86_15540 [Paenibacillus flagellatus]